MTGPYRNPSLPPLGGPGPAARGLASLGSLRLDSAIGIARWLRDVADPQMDRLRNPDQRPFVACGDRHLLPPALPLSPAPGGFWAGTAQNPCA